MTDIDYSAPFHQNGHTQVPVQSTNTNPNFQQTLLNAPNLNFDETKNNETEEKGFNTIEKNPPPPSNL